MSELRDVELNTGNSELKEKRAEARKALEKLCQDGPAPTPPSTITITPTEDLVARNGRRHKAVKVRWNYSRRLSMPEMMILSYYQDNQILLDREGRCFGFEDRKKDYDDYVIEAGVSYE
jgi:hypothetical protein